MNKPNGTAAGNLAFFRSILQMKQDALKHTLKKMLRESGYTATDQPGFLYAAGDIPVLLVAHLDTVHQMKPEIICISEDGRWMMSPQGIGGDDRCGVYMIMQIIKSVRCHVLFCEDEESGCRGARAFAQSDLQPHVNYIVEMDRRGNNDAVFYNCHNPSFTEFICGFGFTEATGSCSDISIVAPYLQRAAVNISSGYYNEHRQHEVIDLHTLENNIQRVAQMVKQPTETFPYMDRRSSWYGQQTLFSFSEDDRVRLLMPLPDTACLVINGCIVNETAQYMLDKNGVVYIYLADLEAAVELENTYACDENGKEISFSIFEAQRLPVITFESAIEQLRLDEVG